MVRDDDAGGVDGDAVVIVVLRGGVAGPVVAVAVSFVFVLVAFFFARGLVILKIILP